MNSLWINESEIQPNGLISIKANSDERFVHLTTIMRIKVGQELKAFILNVSNCRVQVMAIHEKEVILVLGPKMTSDWVPNINLIVGLSRPQTIKKILELGTTMGVSNFIFLPAALSEKSYATSKVFEQEEIDKHLLHGLAQSGKFFKRPQVTLLKSFKQVDKIGENSNKYLCSLQAQGKTFCKQSARKDQAITIAIGSERGWTEEEELQFIRFGYAPVSLYPTTLRVEAAVVSALTQWYFGVKSNDDH